MQKVRPRRKPYSALARSFGGELVVGLIRVTCRFPRLIRSLPDLITRLPGYSRSGLAFHLRVYWAYSAHDSYPSKLASKQLCDVILGITPD